MAALSLVKAADPRSLSSRADRLRSLSRLGDREDHLPLVTDVGRGGLLPRPMLPTGSGGSRNRERCERVTHRVSRGERG
jgi:hypothetical protein